MWLTDWKMVEKKLKGDAWIRPFRSLGFKSTLLSFGFDSLRFFMISTSFVSLCGFIGIIHSPTLALLNHMSCSVNASNPLLQ